MEDLDIVTASSLLHFRSQSHNFLQQFRFDPLSKSPYRHPPDTFQPYLTPPGPGHRQGRRRSVRPGFKHLSLLHSTDFIDLHPGPLLRLGLGPTHTQTECYFYQFPMINRFGERWSGKTVAGGGYPGRRNQPPRSPSHQIRRPSQCGHGS